MPTDGRTDGHDEANNHSSLLCKGASETERLDKYKWNSEMEFKIGSSLELE